MTIINDELVRRLNLGTANAQDLLIRALDQYRKNPLFCIPDQALEIFARNGKSTRFMLLGTKDFAAVFISIIAGRGQVLHVVDDFQVASGKPFHGVSLTTSSRFVEMARQDEDIIAINCCRFDYSRRFFENLCRQHDIAVLNHEQAVRMIGLNDVVDHRLTDWAPVISERFEAFQALQHRFADSYSSETLAGILTFHLTCNPEYHLNISRPYSSLYFRSGLFSLTEREKLVDCGASIGESTTALIGVTGGRFSHSWMIEPDRYNVETLQKLKRAHAGSATEGKLSLHPVALGSTESEAPFHHQGGHSGSIAMHDLSASLEKVLIRPIDNIIDDVPTFIKMDIEGFELSALQGGVRAIQAGRPKLAISAYHRATDLLEIPAYIDGIAPGYRLGLRHHTEDRWDSCLYFY
ncbi:FkbM family methyltransferase [Acidovorax sp. SUPP3334]|uniref:FkbM family methyltransferase n=1 Tax=Acidovorax sp. SUPP3334 TaxID=2920881 RepID=UPI0023DE3AD7|nr:FkbM family methyltransferase [Acidovorax sp. SUPP3334]GKT24228.1 FkbM family methyltransferase [Acidovorax sp. SUPP3334]